MLFKLFHKVYFMGSQVIKGTFIGMGVLLAVLIMGVLTFNYFNKKVDVVDNTETIITVYNSDGIEELGYIKTELTELTSTVTDEEFAKYFETNKKTLFNEEYEYSNFVELENGDVEEQVLKTDNSFSDFLYGMVTKLQSDFDDKFVFVVEEVVLINY